MGSDVKQLDITGSRIAQNTFHNLLGFLLPLAVSIIAIPLLIGGLGTVRFGIILLAWSLVGYFNLFDIGLSRATTKYVAEHLSRGEIGALPPLIWTSLTFLLGLGVLAMLAAFALTPWLVSDLFHLPAELVEEATNAFYLVGISIPFLLLSTGVRGVLEAQQRFALINLIKAPASMANYILPLVILLFTERLDAIVAVLVVTRLVVLLLYLFFCLSSIPGLFRPRLPSASAARRLLAFGGWMTVSSVISPIMVYMDRFVIASVLLLSDVTYYVTPYELLAKLMILSESFLSVLFPAFSAIAIEGRSRLAGMGLKAVKVLIVAFAPVTAAVILLAEPFLGLWLGADFARLSTPVMQLLAVGVLINVVARVPFNMIQALGRPDLTAKLHILELPVYLGMILVLLPTMGITGAALAWVLRVLLDAVLLFLAAKSQLRGDDAAGLLRFFPLMLCAVFALALSYTLTYLRAVYIEVGLFALVIAALSILTWKKLLDEEERRQAVAILTGFFRYKVDRME